LEHQPFLVQSFTTPHVNWNLQRFRVLRQCALSIAVQVTHECKADSLAYLKPRCF